MSKWPYQLGKRKARTRRPSHVPGCMNKTETAYWMRLSALDKEGVIDGFYFEPITLRLAERTTYTPDFLLLRVASGGLGSPEFHEVKAQRKGKAHWEQASRVKIKTAAAKFPQFRFLGVSQSKDGSWEEEEFQP